MEHFLSLFVKATFIENMALAFFLGMCSFIGISGKTSTAWRTSSLSMLASTSSSNLSEGAFTDVLHWWSLSDFDLVRFFDKTTRFKIKEGMGALAQQMLMDSTAEVALSTPVRSIDKSGSTYQVTTAGDKGFRARAVVMAVPRAPPET